MSLSLGYSQQTRGAWHLWRGCFEEAAKAGEVPEVKRKVFKPKFPELPVL